MRPAATIENRHLLPMHWVTPDRLEYFARPLREAWNTKRQIELLHLSFRELSGQSHVRDVILGDHKASASLFVEPVHDAWPQFATDSAQVRNAMEQRINESPGPNAGPGVNRHPGGFIDHDELFILVQHRDRNVFRLQDRFLWFRFRNVDPVTGTDRLFRSARFTIQLDVPCPNQRLDSGTR
jgi:hypothetical protein